jgi:site-specific recombinase XerD
MLEKYLHSLAVSGKSDRTIATRKIQLNSFLAWLLKETNSNDPLEITSIDAAKYRKHLQARGLEPNTINTALSAIYAICSWMVKEGHLAYNPVAEVERVGIVATAPRGLDKNEQHRLIRTAATLKNKRNYVIVMTLLFSGLRVSEIVELTIYDVTISERSGSIRVRAGKGNKYRIVPIEKELRKCLSDFLIVERVYGEYLFEGQRNPKMTTRAIQLICNKVGEKAKITELTPHVLRHTLAHNLISAGVPIDRVAMILGHANINTTAIYTKPSLEDLQSAMDKLSYNIPSIS